MTTAINIYATSSRTISDGTNGLNVTVGGIDPSQVAKEFALSELLDAFDVSDIQDYLTKRMEDDSDE